ncbi:MAG TPA: transposase, partial [Terracidiphilus sp.]|nr:transposase [Terracidiphilus sp.]
NWPTIDRMTQGLKRYQYAGDLHFITFSCYQRNPYLASPSARSLFEESLERTRVRYGFCVIGYVVMIEHLHLLVSEPVSGPLAKAIHALKLSMSKMSSQRPFWQARYYDFNVFSHRKHVEKLRYIHRNPVERGLVEKPEDWRWSSFRHYATGERGIVEIESYWTAALREKDGLIKTLKDNKRL